jgi:hypothetical protein
MYQYFHLYSHYTEVYIYFLVKLHTLALFSKSTTLSPLTCISLPSIWSQRYDWLMHIHYMQSWTACDFYKWNMIIEADWQNYLQPNHILPCLIIVTFHYYLLQLWLPHWWQTFLIAVWAAFVLPSQVQAYYEWMNCATKAICSSKQQLKNLWNHH